MAPTPTGDESSDIEDLPRGWGGLNGNTDEESKGEAQSQSQSNPGIRSTRSKLSLKQVKIDVLSQNLAGPTRSRGGSSSNATVSRSSKASETSGPEETERKERNGSKRSKRYRHRVVERSMQRSPLLPATDREPLLERVLESMSCMQKITREAVEKSVGAVEKLAQQVQENKNDNGPVLEKVIESLNLEKVLESMNNIHKSNLESMNNIHKSTKEMVTCTQKVMETVTCTQMVMEKMTQQVINQTETMTILASQFKEMKVSNEESKVTQEQALERLKKDGKAVRKENQKLSKGLEAKLKICIEKSRDDAIQKAKQLHEDNREELIELHETKTQFVLRIEKAENKWITSNDVVTTLRRANYDKIKSQDIKRISNITGKRRSTVDERTEIALVQLRTEAQTQKLLYDAYNTENEGLASIVRRAKTKRLRNDEKAVRRRVAAKNKCKGPKEAVPNWGIWKCNIRYKDREKTHPMYAAKAEALPEDWWNEQSREEWKRKNTGQKTKEDENHSPETHRRRTVVKPSNE